MFPKYIRVPAPALSWPPSGSQRCGLSRGGWSPRVAEVQGEPGVSRSVPEPGMAFVPIHTGQPLGHTGSHAWSGQPGGVSRCSVESAHSFPRVTQLRTEKQAGNRSLCFPVLPPVFPGSPGNGVQSAPSSQPGSRFPLLEDQHHQITFKWLEHHVPIGDGSLQGPLLRCPGLSSGLNSAFHFHPSPLSWE